jgi:HK97 family phage prohead protease
MNPKPYSGQKLERTVTLNRAAANLSECTVPAALSSEKPVARLFGNEILIHDKSAVNMERAADGLPLLFSHDSGKLLGRVEDIAIATDRKLRGLLRFANSAAGDEALSLVRQGVLRDVSIGYRIDKWEETGADDEVRITRWTPLEASMVSVPADHTVGLNRALEMTDVSDETTENRAPAQPITPEPIAIERERVGQIRNVFGLHLNRSPGAADLMVRAVSEGWTPDNASRQLLDLLGREGPGALGGDFRQSQQLGGSFSRSGRIEVRDQLPEFLRAAEDALAMRCGVKVAEAHPAAQDLQRTSLVEMAEICLRQRGVNTAGWGRAQIVGRAFASHSTSDFPLLLANTAGKALMAGYENEPASHRQWVRTSEVNDFKEQSRVARSAAPSLLEVGELAEYTEGSMSERGETFALKTYGRIFSISRQAVINDDLNALSGLAGAFGAAGARLEADTVYAILTANGNMTDGNPLLDVTHDNVGTPAALTVASLGEARKLMRLQTGVGGVGRLNLRPRFLIVPAALETTAEQLLATLVDPSKSNDTQNPTWIRGLELVVDSRLDDDDVNAWYLAADSAQADHVEVAYLAGQRGVFVQEEEGFTVDALRVKARLDFTAAAIDWRGLVYNAGA